MQPGHELGALRRAQRPPLAEPADEAPRPGRRESIADPCRRDVKSRADGRAALYLLEVGAEVNDAADEGEEDDERGRIRRGERGPAEQREVDQRFGLPYARAALAAAAGTRLALDELRGLVRGSVAVGMVPSCSAVNLPDILADFHRQHPDVVITLSEASSDELADSVVSGALDLALIGMAGTLPGLDIVLVADEPLIAAVSCDDPLAGTTALAALAERAIISLPQGSGLRAALDRACAAAGVRLRVAFEATDPQVLAHLASRGLGVAVLPKSAAANSRNPLRVIRIAGPELRGQLALAWRTGGPASPAARALIAHARAALQISSPHPADVLADG